MYPVQRGLYGHQRTTITQFANPEQSMTGFDPFPFTNANLADLPSRTHHSPSSSYNELTKENSPMKKPQSQEERRAEHNAIERARRETLNAKFQSLAQALPNLMNYRRPSKSQIVEKALDWVKQSISREERYRCQILHLQRENKQLLVQLMQYQQQESNCSSTTSLVSNSHSTASSAGLTPLYAWSGPGLMNTTQLVAGTDDVSRQSLSSPKSEDEDNISSIHEEETDYQTSPYQFSYQKPQKKQYHLQYAMSDNQALLNDFSYDINVYSTEPNVAFNPHV